MIPLALLVLSVMVGCEPAFTGDVVLGGSTIPAARLNVGHSTYTYYCISCHGSDGDGRGRSAEGLTPPPRDLRLASYKFTGTPMGYLPTDPVLADLVRSGLHGTAMLEWSLPDHLLYPLIDYIKTFSPEGDGWRDPDSEVTEPYDAGPDPWTESPEEAIIEGASLFHSVAECATCHPAHQTMAETNADRVRLGMPAKSNYRKQRWHSKPKESTTYSVPIAGDPQCETKRDCDDGDGLCRYGRCEQPLVILPPDFTSRSLRKARDVTDLSRIIGAGIPGTAMPSWSETLEASEIWALAHYVSSLIDMKGSPEARALRESLVLDTEPILLNTVDPEE